MRPRERYIFMLFTVFVLLILSNAELTGANQGYRQQIEAAKINVDKYNLKIIHQSLERYYLDHGKYPESLERLVPDYLSEVPKIQQTGKELKYKFEADKYVLYISKSEKVDNNFRIG